MAMCYVNEDAAEMDTLYVGGAKGRIMVRAYHVIIM